MYLKVFNVIQMIIFSNINTLRVNCIKQLKYLTLILYQISVTKGVKLRFNLLLTGQFGYTI